MTPSETNAESDRPVRSSINVPPDLVVGLLGSADENLRALEKLLAADIHARGNAITLSGEPADVALAERAISELIAIVASGQPLTAEVVRHSVAMLTGTEGESPAEVLTLDILSRRGKTIRPKTLNQKRYVDAIDTHTIVFAIGPAGTGKTYLAMAKAVRALQTKQVSRIILTRPAVEAGERLGFLPGTLSEKIDPYLRPLYDALHDMMDPELIPKLMSAGVIEVAPLAYMRGRGTLSKKTEFDYSLVRRVGRGGDVRIKNPVTEIVRRLGLAGVKSDDKFVPVEYLRNTADVRLAVLQGLFDTDGGPVTQDGRTCRVQYGTASEQLADDVTFLVRSLGGVVYRRIRKAEGRKPGLARGRLVHHRADAHILDIRLPQGIVPFRLARKIAKYDVTGGGRPMRYIDRIEPAGTEEAACIRVAAEDSLYVTEDFLLTHNTISDAFIILDEAQNTTGEQMKMFLTRLGFGSKMVVTGDITQVDLPGGNNSGLRSAVEILDGVDDIHIAELTTSDVVRHRLVGEIVDAYAKFEDPGLMNRAQRRASGNRPRR